MNSAVWDHRGLMVGEPAPVPVDLDRADRGFWTRFHELRRIQHAELRPDEPPQPDEQVEVNLKKEDPFEFHHWYEISSEGRMLSVFHGWSIQPSNPEYETNRHLMWADAYVRPELRRRRLASRWLTVAAELMDRRGVTVLGASAVVEPGNDFLRWLGAQPKLTSIESRLELARVDWEMLERWVSEGTERSPQTRLEIYDGRIPEGLWEDLAPQLTAMFNTMPRGELDMGDIVFTPERLRDWDERLEATGERNYTVMTREPDGVISGFTGVSWAAYRRRVGYQEFTGVRTDARGRGLGKWIKAAMLLHLRELHPDLESIVTDNAQSNGPMLNINRALGFQRYREEIEYQISRSQLDQKIRSL